MRITDRQGSLNCADMGLRDLLMNHGMAEGGLDLPDVLNALATGGVLVDVRTSREYEAGHAPGARLVNPKELLADPFTAVYGDDPLAEPDPHFILVCDTGCLLYTSPSPRD